MYISACFYMDIKTGMLVRLSDSYKRKFKEMEERKDRKKSDNGVQTAWIRMKYDYDHAEDFIQNFNVWRKKEMEEMDIQNDLMDFLNFYMNDKKAHCIEEEN